MPVHMTVLHHQLVGAWLARLTETGARPATLKEFLQGLAAFVNAELRVSTIEAAYAPATRSWRIPGVVEMTDIDEDATVAYATHKADEVVVRLPDPALLAESKNLAIAYDTDNRRGQFYLDRFYYDYANGNYTIKNREFLESRIADYTFASCR